MTVPVKSKLITFNDKLYKLDNRLVPAKFTGISAGQIPPEPVPDSPEPEFQSGPNSIIRIGGPYFCKAYFFTHFYTLFGF